MPLWAARSAGLPESVRSTALSPWVPAATNAQAPEVAEAMVEVDAVAEAYSVAGEYDVVAIVKTRDYDSMARLVPEELSRIPGITGTRTLMAFRRYSTKLMEQMWELGFSDEPEA